MKQHQKVNLRIDNHFVIQYPWNKSGCKPINYKYKSINNIRWCCLIIYQWQFSSLRFSNNNNYNVLTALSVFDFEVWFRIKHGQRACQAKHETGILNLLTIYKNLWSILNPHLWPKFYNKLVFSNNCLWKQVNIIEFTLRSFIRPAL